MLMTHTDDVAVVLPAALEGPLQVTDSADHESYLKIDPALGRISAAGAARPLRRLSVGVTKNTGPSSAGALGVGMSCRQITPGNDGGIFTNCFAIPSDMDLAEASSVFVLIAPVASSALTGAVVRLDLVAGYTSHGRSSPHSTTVVHDYTVPDAWQVNSAEEVLIDDGNGRTFAPGLFDSGDLAGLRVRLVRSAVEDTFDQNVNIASGVVFEYTATVI